MLLGCSVEDDCPRGAETCECAESSACDPGLECLSGLCVEQLSSSGGSRGSGGASNVPGAAASSSGGATQPEQPDPTVARVTFCNDAQFEGMDTTFRLLVLDQVFDAYSQTCSGCQDLPASTLLDFVVQKMPEAVEVGSFSAELTPGGHVISATVEDGEGVIRDNELRANQRCEDVSP